MLLLLLLLPVEQRELDPVTVFMGVPTMYSFLLHKFEEMPAEQQQAARAAAGRLRLTVSGSSACPLPVMNSWEALSGAWVGVWVEAERADCGW